MFFKNPVDMSNDELLKEVSKLQKTLSSACSLGYMQMIPQIQFALEEFRSEYISRTQKALEKTLKDHGEDFDELVKIEK